MTELVASILAVGALIPLLISIVNQPRWSTQTRTVMSVGVAALAGLVTFVADNGLDFSSPSRLITTVVGVILAATTSYSTIWKPSGVAPSIEHATSKSDSTGTGL